MKYNNTNVYLIFVFLLCLIFRPDKDLDLSRYYADVETWHNMDYYQVAMHNIVVHGDFLYFVFLKLFTDIGFPVQFVTALFTSLFYKGAFLILDDAYKSGHYSLQSKRIAEKSVVFTVPIHLIISIARMTCSFSFVFLAIHMYNNKKYVIALILVILALCSHTGTSLFVGLFALFEFLLWLSRKIKHQISSKQLTVFMIFGGLFIIYAFSFLAEYIERIPYFAAHSYYITYLKDIEHASYKENGFITYITMIIYIILNSIYALFSNLDKKSQYCTCISCIVPIFYFLGNLFSMRTCMFSIPFFSVCLMGAYNSVHNKSIISLVSFITIGLFFLVLLAIVL